MDEEDVVKLPLEIQMWLLEQSGHFLRTKLDDKKYEAACVLFERVLCGYRKRELKGKLQVVCSDLIHHLESVKRWDFVKAACPYVIQCTAQVLSNRRNLGLSDRLSVAVTKLLSTFHWCLIDAPSECYLDPCAVVCPANTVELFIQLLVPCAHEIHEQDLTFSLKSGIMIWQPLWKNLCPNIPSFKRPALLEKHRRQSNSSATLSNPVQTRVVLKYFDVIVLQSLSSNCLSEESLSWSLAYILQILQSELFLFCDVSDSWPSFRHHRQWGKRAVAVQHSLPLLSSNFDRRRLVPGPESLQSEQSPQDIYPESSCDKEHGLKPVYLSNEYEQWFKDSGTINHNAILTLLYKISRNATLRLCETLVYMLHVLVEISVIPEQENQDGGSFNLETAVFCLLDLITMIGCCNNDSGMRGSKGKNLRQLSHDLFAKLVSTFPQQVSVFAALYVKQSTVAHVLEFFHSFTGLCFSKLTLSPAQSSSKKSWSDLGTKHRSLQIEESDSSVSFEVRDKNEALLINWTCIQLLDKLMAQEKSCKEKYVESVSKVLTYVMKEHPKIMRKMVMNGILNSFSKPSKNVQDKEGESYTDAASKAEPKEPKVKKKLKTKTNTSVSSSASSNFSKSRKRLPFKKWRGITAEENAEHHSEIPGGSISFSSLSRPIKSWKETNRGSSNGNKFKIFKGNRRPRYATLVYGPVDEEDSSQVFLDKGDNLKGIDFDELLKGMKAFRFMSSFVAPCHLPEISLMGALMDLKAPVLARAAMLLECCHLVHLCNKGDWDCCSRPEFATKKDLAMTLYKWGTTIGEKLAAILKQESEDGNDWLEETASVEAIEKSTLNETDLSVVSSDCPFTIRLLACQLLLEITAFLRDNYLSHLLERENPSACTAKSNMENVRKISSMSTNRLGKSLLLKVPLTPAIAVQDETGSTSATLRKSSGYSRFGVCTSPKYRRKIARKAAKSHYLHGERRMSRPYKDNQHITSSFDDDDEIPHEAADFPWMAGVICFIKTLDKKVSKSDSLLSKLQKSWHGLCEGFEALYNPRQKNSVEPPTRRRALFGELLSAQLKSEADKRDPIMDYIKFKIAGLQHAPFSVACKAALVTDRSQIMELISCAWNMLSHPDQHVASTCAALVLIGGARLENFATSFIKRELSKPDPNDRVKAILRFGNLWKCRNFAVCKMETNGIVTLKIPPPKIEYTLPSPLIGRDPPSTTDAPWYAGSPVLDEVEEVGISHSEWYFDEEKRTALKEKQRSETIKKLRKAYRLTTVSLSQEAGTENRRKTEDEEEDDAWTAYVQQDHIAAAHELFPPAICAVALDVIRLLDDSALNSNKISVGCLAHQVVWQCIVEDPELFFRTMYENITKTDKQDEILLVLRKLVQQIPDLPPVAGTLLFNNLVGLIMYYSRTNKPGCQEKISSVLDVLWRLTPSVSGLFLKEMKQTLRKENCEHVFMITSNVPGTKEIRVTLNGRTEKFQVREDMTFSSLIKECERVFDTFDRSFVLVDKHSGQVMEATRLVRDAYSFRRGFASPLMKLDTMNPARCYERLQRQTFFMKLSEISRLNLARSIFHGNPSQKHIKFLFLEFLKQTAFPRKAIEFEFQLCQDRGMARELIRLDVILKDTWVKFVCLLLGNLCESATASYEIELFLNVLNGALLLLGENIVVLRSCLAGFLNICRHFEHVFAVNGYRYILPTILKVYCQHQDNSLVVDAIEFIVGQFLTLHQNPFLLQLFASAAPMMRSEVTQDLLVTNTMDYITAGVLCKLLLSLDKNIDDTLGILSLVSGDKPIQACDSACKIENVEFSMFDIAVRLGVTVIASEPRSQRATEMLVVTTSIIPHYLLYLKQTTDAARCSQDDNEAQEAMTKEIKQIRILYNYLKVIIENSKHLSSPFKCEFIEIQDGDGPFLDESSFGLNPNMLSLSWWSSVFGNVKSWFGWKSDNLAYSEDIDRISETDELPMSSEEKNAVRKFCLPRVTLLFLVTEFLTNAASRVKEIRYLIRRKISVPDIVIERGQVSTISNILTSLLSLSPKNQELLLSIGFQRFMLYAMSSIDWSGDQETHLAQIICKVNRLLQKIVNHAEHQEFVCWDVLETVLRGINLTIWKQSQLSLLPEIKDLLDWCLQLILCESFDSINCSFANVAAKLAARLIQAKPDIFSLPIVCGDYHLSTDLDRVEKFFINWLLPLCFRLGTGRYDYPRLFDDDVEFALSITLTLLSPMLCQFNFGSNNDLDSLHSLVNDTNSTALRTRSSSQSIVLTSKTYKILFLGLKILVVAFEDSFIHHWKQVAEVIQRLIETNKNEPALWDFLHFIVDNRSPLLIHLMPIVAEKAGNEENLSNEIRSCKTRIKRDFWNPTSCTCRTDVLRRLLDDLTDLKHDNIEMEVLRPLSPPPRGRIRSKSTHNDRSMMITKFDKEWESYDKETNISNEPFGDGADGCDAIEQLPKRKASTKRVKISAEPIVIEEERGRSASFHGDEGQQKTSPRVVLKSRPVLKRQSAEDESNDSFTTDAKSDLPLATNDASNPEKSRPFNWQRFNRVRKREDSRPVRARKRDRWKRENSFNYRQKMQHQVSFNEEEEEEDENMKGTEELDDAKIGMEARIPVNDRKSSEENNGKMSPVFSDYAIEDEAQVANSFASFNDRKIAEEEEKRQFSDDSLPYTKKVKNESENDAIKINFDKNGEESFTSPNGNGATDKEVVNVSYARKAFQGHPILTRGKAHIDNISSIKLELDKHSLILLESKQLRNPLFNVEKAASISIPNETSSVANGNRTKRTEKESSISNNADNIDSIETDK